MAKLKLPRTPRPPVDAELLPPALRWDAPPSSALLLLSRREFLKALAVLMAALAAPLTGARRALAATRGRFFTRPELATLEALCDRIIPPDTGPDGQPSPGGKDLGAAVYIDRLLAAFDHRVPLIYAGGPFSGRTPFPDNTRGVPSRRRPRNAFRHFIPLSRVQDIRWRAELFGSDSPQAAGANFNDAVLGPLKGLRQVYRDGLKKIDEVATAMAGAPFAQLSTMEQDRVLPLLDDAFAPDLRRNGDRFTDLLIRHTIEGCFSVPEYGGNRRLAGWKLIGLEGDNQPLGYSIFSRTDTEHPYHERADHPMSTADPQNPPVSADGLEVQTNIATFSDALSGTPC